MQNHVILFAIFVQQIQQANPTYTLEQCQQQAIDLIKSCEAFVAAGK